MDNKYSWIIKQMDVIPDLDGIKNFVTRIYWTYNADDGSGYTSKIDGLTELGSNDQNSYFNYADLTQDIVIGWLEGIQNLDELRSILDSNIANQINPPIITLPLPWDSA